MNCSGGGSNSDNPPSFTFPCFQNLVPPGGHGWPHGIAITVDVDPHWSDSERTSICLGLVGWGVVGPNTYNCVKAPYSVPPTRWNPSYPNLWITYRPDFVDGFSEPRAETHRCGYFKSDGQCPGTITQSWMGLGPYTDTQLQGAATHEEGHDNWLWDCPNCELGGSAMGSQQTWSSDQPTSPTACDIIWSTVWSLI